MASSIERFAAAVLASVLTASVATAAVQWLKLTSSHFELYTTAGEKKGREAILFYEQVRDFFARARANAKPVTDAPVRIIAFRSAPIKNTSPTGSVSRLTRSTWMATIAITS